MMKPIQSKKQKYTIKDHLILRDHLAIDRTKLANFRTFLSIVRTALYFSFTGISIYSLEWLKEWKQIAWIFFAISFVILLVGTIMYFRFRNRIDSSYDPDIIRSEDSDNL